MSKSKISNAYVLYGGAVIVAIGLIFFAANQDKAPSIYDEFAQCLTEQGVTMYGAWWCPHCTNQKEAFGDAFDSVNYVECSSPGSRSMNSTCQAAGIEGYPTWEFADGTRASGEQDLEFLSEQAGCELPESVE
ncbi:hypothetical protein CO174_04305 [Candidatus Uhrbacteria bacterium CG_4_9_14_3_um_filter_50_9]|uniref:Thioredoxin domain-containing protein n=1 Tax=Candidatus Uhrbacteria bacterium CG_4_9_14_3_um_filter_50_9 TaxID=1975035 RepID=A0A2M7XBK3_9BACT|nr:MAG: hypothetical protein CO174_04305 [Candidatus Uhrbacteria bacterium CG_4_9_14_3_um_filter_50_9]